MTGVVPCDRERDFLPATLATLRGLKLDDALLGDLDAKDLDFWMARSAFLPTD